MKPIAQHIGLVLAVLVTVVGFSCSTTNVADTETGSETTNGMTVSASIAGIEIRTRPNIAVCVYGEDYLAYSPNEGFSSCITTDSTGTAMVPQVTGGIYTIIARGADSGAVIFDVTIRDDSTRSMYEDTLENLSSVSGLVTNTTGTVADSTVIFVQGTDLFAIPNAFGRFDLLNVPAGVYEFKIRYLQSNPAGFDIPKVESAGEIEILPNSNTTNNITVKLNPGIPTLQSFPKL